MTSKITLLVRFTQYFVIFLGAYLMFQVEPVAGKIVTAKFGGTSGVWSTCILFFQLVLLAGYLFTYLVTRLSPIAQSAIYAAVFLLSSMVSRIPQPDVWGIGDTQRPVLSLLILLATYLAVPCLLLSSISGVMQVWYRLNRFGDPYRLYALSNVGSLGALLSYPVVVEPNFTISRTLNLWNLAYCLLALLVAACSIYLFSNRQSAEQVFRLPEDPGAASAVKPGPLLFTWWCILTAMSSSCLIAYTSYLTQDVAPIPLLWVVPLSLYLLTFILCFANQRWYLPKLYLLVAPVLWILEPLLRFSIVLNASCILALIFCFCMTCHGELVMHKPAP